MLQKKDDVMFLKQWTYIEGCKKQKLLIQRYDDTLTVFLGRMCAFSFKYNESEKSDDVKIYAACQNYLFHEKVVASYKYRIGHCKKNRCIKNVQFSSIKNAIKIDDDTTLKNFVTDEADEDAWNFYQMAYDAYNAPDYDVAFQYVIAASSSLSENLAVLELYAFCMKKRGEKERAIRLIESNIKHAPFVEEYRIAARNLIARLNGEDDRLFFSPKNRGIYHLALPLVPASI